MPKKVPSASSSNKNSSNCFTKDASGRDAAEREGLGRWLEVPAGAKLLSTLRVRRLA
jgi:hypothetical protein